jgi:hypothetical protein
MQRIRAVLLFSALVPACVAEDDEPPSVVGKPLEEQIDVIEDVLCAHTARCGIAGSSATTATVPTAVAAP